MASSSMSAVVAGLGSPPSQKLTPENFLFWKALVFPTLCGARVLGLLDGSDASPPQNLEGEDDKDPEKKKTVENLAYNVWLERDQQVVSYLVNSLSPAVLAHVLGLNTAAEIWAAITDLFASQSRSRVQHLRTAGRIGGASLINSMNWKIEEGI